MEPLRLLAEGGAASRRQFGDKMFYTFYQRDAGAVRPRKVRELRSALRIQPGSAVLGSITALTNETLLHGSPDFLAC